MSIFRNGITVAAVVIVTAGWVASGPAVAATAVPPLPAGATQAFASLDGVNPITAPTTRTFKGSVTVIGVGGMTVTCTIASTVVFNVDGTALAHSIVFSPAPCPTSMPGCFATAGPSPAPSNAWGRRLISWPGASGAPSGSYDIVNVSHQNTFSGTCGPLPLGLPLTRTGVVWLRVAPAAGGSVSSATPTAPNNVLFNPSLGSTTLSGPLIRTASEPALYVV